MIMVFQYVITYWTNTTEKMMNHGESPYLQKDGLSQNYGQSYDIDLEVMTFI